MSLTKKYLKSKPICKVTFTVPASEASTVAVAGDFNNFYPNTALSVLSALYVATKPNIPRKEKA